MGQNRANLAAAYLELKRQRDDANTAGDHHLADMIDAKMTGMVEAHTLYCADEHAFTYLLRDYADYMRHA